MKQQENLQKLARDRGYDNIEELMKAYKYESNTNARKILFTLVDVLYSPGKIKDVVGKDFGLDMLLCLLADSDQELKENLDNYICVDSYVDTLANVKNEFNIINKREQLLQNILKK